MIKVFLKFDSLKVTRYRTVCVKFYVLVVIPVYDLALQVFNMNKTI